MRFLRYGLGMTVGAIGVACVLVIAFYITYAQQDSGPVLREVVPSATPSVLDLALELLPSPTPSPTAAGRAAIRIPRLPSLPPSVPKPKPKPKPPTPPPPAGSVVIAAAGDIACDPSSSDFNSGNGTSSTCRQRYTSDILTARNYSAILALGDLQYEKGEYADFQASYHPSWGRVKSKTYPAPGNHEYGTSGAAGYFQYWGSRAGSSSRGYYSFNLGAWHVVALNSNCGAIGGCAAGSAQEQWLRADLAAHHNTCTLAFWHHPRFSSGGHGNNSATDGLVRALYDAGADVVLVGHDHLYERFAPLDANGGADPSRGIRHFTVGSGGKDHDSFGSVKPNSQARNGSTFGVLELTLSSSSYSWHFMPEAGHSFTDSGSDSCH